MPGSSSIATLLEMLISRGLLEDVMDIYMPRVYQEEFLILPLAPILDIPSCTQMRSREVFLSTKALRFHVLMQMCPVKSQRANA